MATVMPGKHYIPAALALALGVAEGAAVAGLDDEVRSAIASHPLGEALVAVSVRDAASGHELVSINAGRQMIPASNQKLFTTGAALHVLGADFEFGTTLLRDGDRLIVLGDGDPAFGDPELLEIMTLNDEPGVDVEQFLDLWVTAVSEAGMAEVREIVVDDRIFDRVLVHPTWPADQLNRPYCAELAGFNFHLNVLRFYPVP